MAIGKAAGGGVGPEVRDARGNPSGLPSGAEMDTAHHGRDGCRQMAKPVCSAIIPMRWNESGISTPLWPKRWACSTCSTGPRTDGP